MPCRDFDDDFPPNNAMAGSDLSAKVNKLTALLCSVCSSTPDDKLPKNVRKWWDEHKKVDRLRIERDIAAAHHKLKQYEKNEAQAAESAEMVRKEIDNLLREQQEILRRK